MNNNAAASLPQSGSQSPVLRGFAHFVSFVCHPVFMPVAMTLVLSLIAPAGFTGMTTKQWVLLVVSIATSTLFFPLFSIALMKPLGFISSYKMPTARERTIPLMATMIFYFWISHVLNNMAGAIPQVLKILMLGNFWGIIMVFIANIFTRVSMHTSAAGGVIGVITVLLFSNSANMIVPLFIAIVLAGIIGTARLILGAHQRGDIWLGYIIGIISQIGAYFYIAN
ncbi:MAG: phosphatase PAP2 family protein [Taibaiella sp.]|nr:phosphatase PAP2 family protein [Taibaiella sp.]